VLLVASLVSVTAAPGMAAPDVSVTVPLTREVVPCAEISTHRNSAKTINANALANGFLAILPPARLVVIRTPDDKRDFE
jgi:hypothetical protein